PRLATPEIRVHKLFHFRESAQARKRKKLRRKPRGLRVINYRLSGDEAKKLGTAGERLRVRTLWDTFKEETTLGNAWHAAKKPSASRSRRKSRKRQNNFTAGIRS